MNIEQSYHGSCFCGEVKFIVSGAPEAMAYCHCTSCRQWSAGPINAFTLWKPEALKITKGENNIGTYNKTAQSYRKWCKTCGGHLFTDHPGMGVVDVPAAVIPDLAYTPSLHVNYQETVLPISDSLIKLRDIPKDMGGSGVSMAT
ncbi:MAG: aldehyde-activating protein [Noviherbaspirillum sp.]|nr:aldehyde-activating protein [Noviherbaspirillum sp.]